MNRYQSRVKQNNEGSFFALIVRVDSDGSENVIHGYKARHFKTEKAAIKSTSNYIAKYC